ncbi:hypothetical protein TSTA_007930 [Talaromyces stipitatus ATCC 10500]|uniref:DUF659 domain-containing protein n=1 Tax=Talaromyces stipitatus (strain ATCC 10500 / CBS 375.48 / QM 6759 / NRRL 1006) TaxID=441959 RepID=B8MVI2_TALSN|nr:uncharacterized protein TSTA_007930 [Talaromyces stipitatus ATCC 10500]EED11503.1 hypothetical protein TSTA_007930 [Talaromyces stipitatus ATCC 10500]
MAEVLQTTLEELNIEHKVLTIIADNAANNETLMPELYFNLKEKFDNMVSPANGERKLQRFQGLDSYMCCIAHALNLITPDHGPLDSENTPAKVAMEAHLSNSSFEG